MTGAAVMALTAFLWSTGGLFIKAIDWNPFAIAGFRSLIASFVVLAWLGRPRLHLSFPQVAAGVANAATMLLFIAANKTTTAANAILLQYVAPVFTALLGAALLKERARAEHWAAFAASGVGMAFMFMDRVEGGTVPGNVLAVLSGITFSLYFVFMRMQKDGSPLESVLLSHWIAAAAGIALSLLYPAPALTIRSAAAIAALGTVQIGVTAILFAIGIKRVSAVTANLICVIEPVFNPLWVFLVLGEAPGVHAMIGGGIVITAVTAASVISAGRRRP